MTERYRKHADLRLTELEGEGIVLHLGSRRYFSVSETGLTVLKELDVGNRSVEELVTALTEQFEVAPETAESSAREFLEKCVEASLLIRVSGD